jgi:DNA-binding response OmpR family regulator
MAKTVLIVEDERAIVEILKFNLKREGYETLEALDGQTGLQLAQTEDPDLILLDVMLPKMNGFDICKTLRAENRATPIIMLTARGEEEDRVQGLKLGADDYIVKPFSIRELLARIEAVLRRSPERPRQLREISIPGATLDSANRLITFKDGRETSLTAREFEFLTYMATHPNRVITRDELLRRVWDVDPRLTDTRSVEMTVMRLRDKLGAISASPLETLRSQGYRWNSSFVS